MSDGSDVDGATLFPLAPELLIFFLLVQAGLSRTGRLWLESEESSLVVTHFPPECLPEFSFKLRRKPWMAIVDWLHCDLSIVFQRFLEFSDEGGRRDRRLL